VRRATSERVRLLRRHQPGLRVRCATSERVRLLRRHRPGLRVRCATSERVRLLRRHRPGLRVWAARAGRLRRLRRQRGLVLHALLLVQLRRGRRLWRDMRRGLVVAIARDPGGRVSDPCPPVAGCDRVRVAQSFIADRRERLTEAFRWRSAGVCVTVL
jgi:hypothetical protein